MPTYSVDTAAVADTAARTRSRIATIQTEVDAMQGDIDQISLALDNAAVCYDDAETTNKGRFAAPAPAPAASTGPVAGQ